MTLAIGLTVVFLVTFVIWVVLLLWLAKKLDGIHRLSPADSSMPQINWRNFPALAAGAMAVEFTIFTLFFGLEPFAVASAVLGVVAIGLFLVRDMMKEAGLIVAYIAVIILFVLSVATFQGEPTRAVTVCDGTAMCLPFLEEPR